MPLVKDIASIYITLLLNGCVPTYSSEAREAEYEGEIDPHTPLFINITYTKKRPSFRQNSWCAKGRMVPCLGVLIRQYCRRFIPPSLYSLLIPPIYVGSDNELLLYYYILLLQFLDQLELS